MRVVTGRVVTVVVTVTVEVGLTFVDDEDLIEVASKKYQDVPESQKLACVAGISRAMSPRGMAPRQPPPDSYLRFCCCPCCRFSTLRACVSRCDDFQTPISRLELKGCRPNTGLSRVALGLSYLGNGCLAGQSQAT